MALAPPPPPRGSWRWLWSLAGPRDKTVLALGVTAALLSGVWTTHVGVAVADALGAFASTPTDTHTIATAARDLVWLACALFVAETVAAAAFAHVATSFTIALRVDARRRVDDHSVSATQAQEIETAETSFRYGEASALAGVVRCCALAVSAFALASSRGSDMNAAMGMNVVVTSIMGIVIGFAAVSIKEYLLKFEFDSYLSMRSKVFARSEFCDIRQIASLNAHDLVQAGHQRSFSSPGFLNVELITPCASLGFLFQNLGHIVFHCGGIVTLGTTPPTDAFETAAGILLASVGLVRFGQHVLATKKHFEAITSLESLLTTTNEDNKIYAPAPTEANTDRLPSHGSGDRSIGLLDVLRVLRPGRLPLFGALLGCAVAGCAIAWTAVVTSDAVVAVVTNYALCVENQDHDYLTSLYSDVKNFSASFTLKSGIISGLFSAVTFSSFQLLRTKALVRIRMLHFGAVCRQRVAASEAPESGGVVAFVAAQHRIASVASKLYGESTAFLLIIVSTGVAALVIASTSRNTKLTAMMVVVATLSVLMDWARNHRLARSAGHSVNAPRTVLIGISAFTKTLLPVVAFWYGHMLLEQGEIQSPGVIVQPLAALALAMAAASVAMQYVMTFYDDWQRICAACADVMELRRHATEAMIQDFPTNPLGNLEFRNVCFQDPMHKTASPLKQLSLTIHAGETVVFCGPPGGGHEHIVALLERFYDPTSGDVLMDGANVKELDTTWLRDRIGLVEAEPVLFNGSISDNIAAGDRHRPTQEEIENAAKLARVHDDIIQFFSDGYRTQISCRRIGNPEPKWQRLYSSAGRDCTPGASRYHQIALARVFLQDPTVLLLTGSAPDISPEDAKIVQQGIDELMASKKRTTIIIGHELPNVRSADRIYVFNDGTITEQGTHEQLIAKESGAYRSLVNGVNAPAG